MIRPVIAAVVASLAFGAHVTNPWFPLRPGDRYVYVGVKAPALVRWPDLELRLEFDESLNTVVVHTPAEGICVEPQTMWPNAPVLAARGVTGTGLRTLASGETLRVSERWSWRAA